MRSFPIRLTGIPPSGSRMEGVRTLQDGRPIHVRTPNSEAKGPAQLHLQNASRDRCPVSGHLSPSVLGVDIPKWRSFLIRLTGVPPRALGWKVFEHCKMEEPSMIEHPILKRKALHSSTLKTHLGTGARILGTCPPARLGWIFADGYPS